MDTNTHGVHVVPFLSLVWLQLLAKDLRVRHEKPAAWFVRVAREARRILTFMQMHRVDATTDLYGQVRLTSVYAGELAEVVPLVEAVERVDGRAIDAVLERFEKALEGGVARHRSIRDAFNPVRSAA